MLSNAKSLGKVFVAQEDETGQQPSDIDVSQNSRKRPLSNGSRRASETEVQPSASEQEEVAPSSFNEAVEDKRWRDSMTAEFKALKNRGCWRVIKTPQGVRLIKSKFKLKELILLKHMRQLQKLRRLGLCWLLRKS